jgi:hypothetical protein
MKTTLTKKGKLNIKKFNKTKNRGKSKYERILSEILIFDTVLFRSEGLTTKNVL